MAETWTEEVSYTTDGKVIVREWREVGPNIRVYRDKAQVPEAKPAKKPASKTAK